SLVDNLAACCGLFLFFWSARVRTRSPRNQDKLLNPAPNSSARSDVNLPVVTAALVKNAASTLPGRKKIFTLVLTQFFSTPAQLESAKRLTSRNRSRARAAPSVIRRFNRLLKLA